MQYANNVIELIGHTPLVKINKLAQGVKPLVLAKLEQLNPGGSVKDRIGIKMIEDAERRGLLKKGGTIVEPTSGNTGVGLAMAAALRGYKCVFVMPDKQSQDKVRLLKAYGAEVVITPTAVEKESPESYYSVAERLAREIPNAFQPNQYANPTNPQTHYETTGPEIWEQTGGRIDAFVAGMGTGGTITGVGRYLKEKNPAIQIVGVDSEGSLYTSDKARPYKLEGIGEDFIPATIDLSIIDHMIMCTDKDAFWTARRLAREEGLLMGGSCGAALWGALRYAEQLGEDKVVVVLLPDTGRNYISRFYSDEYMKENGFWEDETRQLTLAQVLDNKRSSVAGLCTVDDSDAVTQAIGLMREHSISQLPVLRDGQVVGSIQESSLMNMLYQRPEVLGQQVAQVMSEPLPSFAVSTPISAVYEALLGGRSAVVVTSEGGAPQGILTKIDVIDYVQKSGAKR
jgi:cystathionine beta-synthase